MNHIVCEWCEATVTDIYHAFCPVCGNRRRLAGRKTEMIYHAIPVNEYGKAVVCPHCENEELTQGEFCKICGNNIINRCADTPDVKSKSMTVKGCGSTLQGNARYCSRCGNESSFYQKGWLADWRSENTKKAIRNASGSDNTIQFKKLREEKAK